MPSSTQRLKRISPEGEERLRTFEELRIAHPSLLQADRWLRELIEYPTGSAALLLYGPTGVGKTTLIERVQRQIRSEMASELRADLTRLPTALIRAPASTAGQFSWRDFFVRGLEALGEPGVEEKQVIPTNPRKPVDVGQFKTVGGARTVFEAAVRLRRPKVVFIDEGSHLTTVGTGVRLLHQLDVIKSLSDATETLFVIAGTYDVVAFRNLNGQLGRRCRDVHFPRYRLDRAPDFAAFRSTVYTFGSRLPIDAEWLVERAEYVYVRSAGCVGILKQWLERAYVAALLEGGSISEAHLERTALPLQALREIASEIVAGERAIAETSETEREVRDLLGLENPRIARRAALPRKRSRQRPGVRNPTSDPVPAP